MKMEKSQTGGEGAYGGIDATGDAGSSAKAKNESGSVEGPRKNIQSENKQDSTIEEENMIPSLGFLNLADNHKPKLIKFGLEPHEVENLLISKVKCFLDKPNMKVIHNIKEKTVVRENVTGEGKLDGRRSANRRFVEEGTIPNESDSPRTVKTNTSNKQGVIKFDNVLKKAYHEAQELFLRSLEALHLLDLPTNTKVQGGYLKLNGIMITPAELCEVVDGVTQKFSSDLIPVKNITSDDMENAYKSCIIICSNRHLMDMVVPNDLLDKKSYDRWKSHVLVYSSFAAFLYVYLEKTGDRI